MHRRKHYQKIAAAARRDEIIGKRTSRIATELAAVLILAALVLAIVFRKEITVENIVGYTPSSIWLAVPVFLVMYAVKSLTVVVYVKLLYIAAGIVFPLPLAVVVNIAGSAVQLMIPFFIGRLGGRGTADFIVKRRPKLGRVAALRQRSNFWFCAFVRAVGVFPVDPVSMYFGACGMPLRDFLLGSLAGILPTMLVSTVLGTAANDPASPAFIISAVLFFLLQAGAAAAFFLWIRRNDAAVKAAEKELKSDESTQ